MESGLQLYSTIKSVLSLIVLLLVCVCLSYCYFNNQSKDYILANNSNISYKHVDSLQNPTTNCDIINSSSDCYYFDEYNDNSNNHYALKSPTTNTPPKIGATNFYYEKANPVNHVNSVMNPTTFILLMIYIVFIIFIISMINLYFIRTNQEYGAILGGIEAVTDITSIFRKK